MHTNSGLGVLLLFRSATVDQRPNLHLGRWCFLLVLNGAAYIAEIVRGSVQSVDPGQTEAARSLALTQGQAMRRSSSPSVQDHDTVADQPVGHHAQDSSLLLAIGLAVAVPGSANLCGNFRTTEVLLIVAAIYFVAVWLLTALANFVDEG